jgi:hypothetical protein
MSSLQSTKGDDAVPARSGRQVSQVAHARRARGAARHRGGVSAADRPRALPRHASSGARAKMRVGRSSAANARARLGHYPGQRHSRRGTSARMHEVRVQGCTLSSLDATPISRISPSPGRVLPSRTIGKAVGSPYAQLTPRNGRKKPCLLPHGSDRYRRPYFAVDLDNRLRRI